MLRTLIGTAVVTVLLSSTLLSAHENFRIIGTIVNFDNWQLAVKTAAGDTYFVMLQESTPIERNKKWVTAKELKPGLSVVVDVWGDTLYDRDLYVARVTLVPPIAPARKK